MVRQPAAGSKMTAREVLPDHLREDPLCRSGFARLFGSEDFSGAKKDEQRI